MLGGGDVNETRVRIVAKENRRASLDTVGGRASVETIANPSTLCGRIWASARSVDEDKKTGS